MTARSRLRRLLRSVLFWTIVGSVAGVATVLLTVAMWAAAEQARVRPDACVARAIPGAKAVEAVPLVAKVQLDQAKYRLSGLGIRGAAPKVEASGRISGHPTNDRRSLRLLAAAVPDTRDVAGKPGNGKYLDLSSFRAKGDCWELGVTDICYPGCNGLTIRFSFVTVPEAAIPELNLSRDGLTDSDLRRLDIERIGEFSVAVPR